jgi:hypothetical protein
MPNRKARSTRERPHAHDAAVTSAAQAAYFREQAERHRRDAERERVFAEMAGGEAAREHADRARHLDAWVSQAESVAAALEGKGRGRH